MNNNPQPNRNPNRRGGASRGRPPQNRGRPPQNAPANPYQNRNPNRPYPPNGNGQHRNPPQNPNAAPNAPYGFHNGQNAYGPQGQGGYNNYNRPPQYQQQPHPDPEYLRRRREMERRQAEAQRQAMRDRERREKQRQKAERERRMKQNLKILGGRLLVFAVILVILCAITGLLFLLFFNHTPDEPDTSGNMTYYFGGSQTRKTPMEEAVADGVVYVCFNDIADYLGMMESGSAEAMRFILPMSDQVPATSAGTGAEESITFHVGGINVEINGQSAQLDLPNIIRGTEVWVSSTFVTEYMNNLSCQYDERKSRVTISRIVDEENSSEEEEIIVYLPVSFKLKNSDALEPLSEEDVLGGQQ